nr:ribonuclease H-like domain-containing protein [Tanacetum cinerariifolium]
MVTRFCVGTNRPTERLNLHVSSVSPLPKSYRDAFSDPNWQNVMHDEYHALIKNKTWTLVHRPPDTNIVHSQIELLIEGTLIHDIQNKGVQRNQQAFYYLEKAAYQLQPGALYLMRAIYLTDKCVKKDIAPALRDAPFKKRCFPSDEDIKNTNRGHSKPKELPVFESYIVKAEEGSDKKLHIKANVLHGSSHYHSRGCSSSADNTIHDVQKQVVTMRFNKSFEAIWTTCSGVSETIYSF